VAGFGTLAAAAIPLAPLVGSSRIHWARSSIGPSHADNIDAQIFFVARLPRCSRGALVGSALAVAGVVFQALLRDRWRPPIRLACRPAPRWAR
jgi:ABC-type Fe3+-siderophore transport system permease subunit